MKKNIIAAVIFLMVAGYVFAKENLAILPFTGGQGDDGETIAELFSYDSQLNNVFSPIPRTTISRAISRERRFQMGSGMTDPDTVVAIANEVGARYVVAGNITSVGKNKLLVISIIDIGNLQLIAGDVQTYNRIDEIRGKLPNMAANIIQATRNNTSALPKLAIVPVQLQGGADQRVADTLAQLLAIYLIRSGKYAVFPRTDSLDKVMDEHNEQVQGHTAAQNIIGMGHGENPDYVLAVIARRPGDSNIFNAGIIDLFTGIQVVGRSVDYRDINDGIRAMERLAIDLTSTGEQVTQRQNEEEKRLHKEEAQRLAAERNAEATDNFLKNSGFCIGFRGGISFAFSEPESMDVLHIPLAITVGIQLGSVFSIQSGFQYSFGDYGHYYDLNYNSDYFDNFFGKSFDRIQIPLLAKFNFSPGTFAFSPFAGIGINIPANIRPGAGGNGDENELDLEAEIFVPMSWIVGANIGVKAGMVTFFTDIRYVGDFGETKMNVVGEGRNITDTYSMSSVDISIGIEFIVPFKKK
jgi:TolB-like protein